LRLSDVLQPKRYEISTISAESGDAKEKENVPYRQRRKSPG
jgi:hypothetical protein